jgi:hypothetical protein
MEGKYPEVGGVRRTSVGPPMAETDRHEPQIYQLRVVLRGISPLIWRRLLVRSDSTVADLHQALEVAFGWDDQHLNRFEIRGREYAVYRDGGGMIGIDARGVRLGDLGPRRACVIAARSTSNNVRVELDTMYTRQAT